MKKKMKRRIRNLEARITQLEQGPQIPANVSYVIPSQEIDTEKIWEKRTTQYNCPAWEYDPYL